MVVCVCQCVNDKKMTRGCWQTSEPAPTLSSPFPPLPPHSQRHRLKVMAEVGVLAPLSFHIAVYLNGAFYGLFGMIEEVDANLLRRGGLPPSGPLFKSLSGELSNLR